MSAARTDTDGRRTSGGFRVGLLAGAAAFLAVAGLVYVWAIRPISGPRFNVEVVSRGADVTRHAGAKVILSDERGVVAAATCRGQCDDVRLQASSGDNVFNVRVLDAAGQPIAASQGAYVSNGYGASTTQWTVSGQDALTVRSGLMRPNGDGASGK